MGPLEVSESKLGAVEPRRRLIDGQLLDLVVCISIEGEDTYGARCSAIVIVDVKDWYPVEFEGGYGRRKFRGG